MSETQMIIKEGLANYAEIAELLKHADQARDEHLRFPSKGTQASLAGLQRHIKLSQATAREAFARQFGWRVGAPFSLRRLTGNTRSSDEAILDFASVDEYFWAGSEPVAIAVHTFIAWEDVFAWSRREGLRIEAIAGSWVSPTDHIGVLLLNINYHHGGQINEPR
jgi:hypothetical protein